MSHDSPTALPETCDVAFKEWAGVCEALERGIQSVVLRKGGVEEGPRGFLPEHAVFWLYPTRVHQAEQGLRVADLARTGRPAGVPAEDIEIGVLARVESVAHLDRPEQLEAIEGFHVWTEETVSRRFHYRRPGLWVLGVRVYRRAGPWHVPVTPEHAGCKTWVPLAPPLATTGLRPVLDDAAFFPLMERLGTALRGYPGN